MRKLVQLAIFTVVQLYEVCIAMYPLKKLAFHMQYQWKQTVPALPLCHC